MGVERDVTPKADQARIRRLQQILGSKRPSPASGYIEGMEDTEVSPSTLVELRSELTKVKGELQKFMEAMHSTKQHTQRLEMDAKDRALDVEKRFDAQLAEFRKSMRADFAALKRENEKALAATKELLVRESSGTRSPASCRTNDLGFGSVFADGENGRAWRKDFLLQSSPQRLERNVAVVRGWLRESPTPRDNAANDQPDREQRHIVYDHLANLPTSLLMTSIRNEAKLYSKHQRIACNINAKEDHQQRPEHPPSPGSHSPAEEAAAPPLRILQKRNARLAHFLGSESDDD